MKWCSEVNLIQAKTRTECTLCVYSAVQKKGTKMLHLEGEAKELGEGRLMFPPFSNEGGEVNFFFKVI